MALLRSRMRSERGLLLAISELQRTHCSVSARSILYFQRIHISYPRSISSNPVRPPLQRNGIRRPFVTHQIKQVLVLTLGNVNTSKILRDGNGKTRQDMSEVSNFPRSYISSRSLASALIVLSSIQERFNGVVIEDFMIPPTIKQKAPCKIYSNLNCSKKVNAALHACMHSSQKKKHRRE